MFDWLDHLEVFWSIESELDGNGEGDGQIDDCDHQSFVKRIEFNLLFGLYPYFLLKVPWKFVNGVGSLDGLEGQVKANL